MSKRANPTAIAEPAAPQGLTAEEHQRAQQAVAEFTQRLAALDAEIASNQAQQVAHEARHAQAVADRDNLPARLSTARAALIVSPGDAAQERYAALCKLQTDGEREIARLTERRGELISEHVRLLAERSAATELLGSLQQSEQAAWEAIGAQRLEAAKQAVALRQEVVDQAKATLAAAEQALAETRQASQAALGSYPALLRSAPEVAPVAEGAPAVTILEAFVQFLGVLEASIADPASEDIMFDSGLHVSNLVGSALAPLKLGYSFRSRDVGMLAATRRAVEREYLPIARRHVPTPVRSR